MQKFWKHFQQNIVAGIIFLLPISVVVIIGGKLLAVFLKFGVVLAQQLGIHGFLGATGTTIGALLGLFLFCYAAGFLVRIRFFSSWRDRLDDFFVAWIPPYRIYREMALKKAAGEKELLPYLNACWLLNDDCWQPAFVLEKYNNGHYLLFIPTAGNTAEGNILVCPENRVSIEQNVSLHEFMNCFAARGLGLAAPSTLRP